MNKSRPLKDKDIFHDFTDKKGEERRFTPMQLIEALSDACDEMDYSNYHTDKFERVQEIIWRYADAEGIPIGKTRVVLETEDRARREKELDDLLAELKDLGL